MKDLLRTEDLSRDDVELLLETAAKFAKEPLSAANHLSNKSVAIYMTNHQHTEMIFVLTNLSSGFPLLLRLKKHSAPSLLFYVPSLKPHPSS